VPVKCDTVFIVLYVQMFQISTLFFTCTCLASMLQKNINRHWIFLTWKNQSTKDFLKSTWRMEVGWKTLPQTGGCHNPL